MSTNKIFLKLKEIKQTKEYQEELKFVFGQDEECRRQFVASKPSIHDNKRKI